MSLLFGKDGRTVPAKYRAHVYMNDDPDTMKKQPYQMACDRHNTFTLSSNKNKKDYTTDFCEDCMEERAKEK